MLAVDGAVSLLPRLARGRDQLARQRKQSRARQTARRRLQRIGQYLGNVRKDFAHKTSRALLDDPRTRLIALEDLKVKNATASELSAVRRSGSPRPPVLAPAEGGRAVIAGALLLTAATARGVRERCARAETMSELAQRRSRSPVSTRILRARWSGTWRGPHGGAISQH